MADLNEIDNDLNLIFDECCLEGCDEAPIQDLASMCGEKYAPENSELKGIILEKLNRCHRTGKISRIDFQSTVKAWILESCAVENTSGQNTTKWSDPSFGSSDSSGGECNLYTSTPLFRRPVNHGLLKRRLVDLVDENQNSSCPQADFSVEREKLGARLSQTEQKIRRMKEQNVSLETRLSQSEQKNHSLEQRVKKLDNELKQKVQSFKNEKEHLNIIITELQNKLKKSEEAFNEISSENQKLRNENGKCHCVDLLSKNDGLENELKHMKKTASLEIQDKETRIFNLQNQLKLSREFELEYKSKISELMVENETLSLTQKELFLTIEELRTDKQALQAKIDESDLIPGTLRDLFGDGEIDQRLEDPKMTLQDEDSLHKSLLKRFEIEDRVVQTDEYVCNCFARNMMNDSAVQTDIAPNNIVEDRAFQTDSSLMDCFLKRQEVNDYAVQTEIPQVGQVEKGVCTTDEATWDLHLIRQEAKDVPVQTDPIRKNDTKDVAVWTEQTEKTSVNLLEDNANQTDDILWDCLLTKPEVENCITQTDFDTPIQFEHRALQTEDILWKCLLKRQGTKAVRVQTDPIPKNDTKDVAVWTDHNFQNPLRSENHYSLGRSARTSWQQGRIIITILLIICLMFTVFTISLFPFRLELRYPNGPPPV